MKLKVYGIALTLCTDEFNLWWDSDKHRDGENQPEGKPGFGIVFSLKAGWVLRPIKKFWKKREENNPWTSGNHWFVLKFPIIFAPFFSIALGQKGLYVGFKTYGVDWDKYDAWLDLKYIKEGNQALALSGSIRRTRV